VLYFNMEPIIVPRIPQDFNTNNNNDLLRIKWNFISELPVDVQCEIFSLINPQTLIRCRMVSKQWLSVLIHDSIWKKVVENIFGETKKVASINTWFDYYRSLRLSWTSWDLVSHHPGIKVLNGNAAECDHHCTHDTHLPIRGRQGVRSGRHYFEVSFNTPSDNRGAFSSLLCAVGVADNSFVTDRKVGAGYTRDNNGIGYYSSGFQFLYGKESEYGSRVTYKIGNTVGFLLDMDKGEIQFYKDRQPVGKLQMLAEGTVGNVELYPLILSERGLTVTITQNAKIPQDLEAMELQ